MKRIEKMTKEEIRNALKKTSECRKYKQKIFGSCDNNNCALCVYDWLNQEIKIKPRIALINTSEELNNAVYEKWECLPYEVEHSTFVNWLKEEVEV